VKGLALVSSGVTPPDEDKGAAFPGGLFRQSGGQIRQNEREKRGFFRQITTPKTMTIN
jgi:hypothetical protein